MSQPVEKRFEMEEKIENVKLDYTFYSGKDLYADSAIENNLLDIVKNHNEEEYNQIIYEQKNGKILYHLSTQRQNLLEWLPIKNTDEVLEIGSECGALSGILAKKAKRVDCIEASKIRSTINAYRNRNYNNINIIVGEFNDIEPNIEKKYDYITLVGVLEYAQLYINSDSPFEDFLTIVMKHLKDNGKLIIAVENKLGMKYWAGCREDNTHTYFSGIENYQNEEKVRTFSKKELEELLQRAGIRQYEFYYPYPDYKMPLAIYSEERLPHKGELNNNICNFDQDRLVLFDEARAFDTIIEEEMFPVFSNSFLVLVE